MKPSEIYRAVLALDVISSYCHGGFSHVHLYQGSILSHRNACRDHGSEMAALSVGVSMFYKRDNIHPSASSVLFSCLLLLLSWTKSPCCCKRMRVLLLVTGCAAKILPGLQGSLPYPWQSLHCLGDKHQARAGESKREPKSLQWKGLLKPMGLPWAPGTDGSCPWRQIQSHVCGLGSVLRSCAVS